MIILIEHTSVASLLTICTILLFHPVYHCTCFTLLTAKYSDAGLNNRVSIHVHMALCRKVNWASASASPAPRAQPFFPSLFFPSYSLRLLSLQERLTV